jgi:protein-S-isoprenylcysteine O-methyltransferase Ste14
MGGVIALAYGIAAYAAFLLSFLYAVGFVANLAAPKTIDSGMVSPLGEALLVNAVLLGLFAVQHSVMARQGFKRWWTKIVPRSVERSTFVLLTSLILLLLFWQWRPLPQPVWTVTDANAALALSVVMWSGWAFAFISTWRLNILNWSCLSGT